MPLRLHTFFLVLFVLAAAGPGLAQERTSIGGGGGSLNLGADWKRGVVEASLGKDQFISRKNFPNTGVIVIELGNVLIHDESDLRWLVQQGLSRSTSRLSQVEIDPPSTEFIHGRPLVVQSMSGTAAGIELEVQIAGLGSEGFGYLLMCFGIKERAKPMREGLVDIAKRIEFPDADSDWARSTELVSRTLSLDAGNVAIVKYRPCYWLLDDDDSNALLDLETPGYEAIVSISSQESHSIEAAMNEAEEAGFSDWPQRTRVSEETLTIQGRPALLLDLDLNSDPPMTGIALQVELERGAYLDLRFIADERPGRFRELVEELIAGFEFSQLVEAFPKPLSLKQLRKADAAEESFLRMAETLGDLPKWPISVVELDGKFIAAHSGGFDVLDPNTSQVESTTADNSYDFSMTTQRGRVLVQNLGREMTTFHEGRVRNTTVTSALITRGPSDSLILARQAEIEFTPGFSAYNLEGNCELVQRFPGEEDSIASFPAASAECLQTDLACENLLFVRHEEGQSSWFTGLQAVAIDLASGEQSELGRWSSLSYSAPAPGSWLVSGRPFRGTDGLYQLWPDGRMERLYSGSCIPVSLNEAGDLVLVAGFGFSTSDKNPESVPLLRVKRDLVAEHDQAAGVPSIPAFLDAVKDAGPLPSFGADWTSCQKYVEKLDLELAKLGMPNAPQSADAIDDWIQEMTNSLALTGEGEEALALLITRILVAEGARFIPGKFGRGALTGTAAVDHEGAFGVVPLDVVRTNTMEDSVWWLPAQDILEAQQGRPLFIGPDSRAIAEAAAPFALRPKALAAVDEGLEATRKLLREHEGNEHLRRFVYPRLVEKGDDAMRLAVARDAWNRDSRKTVDLLQFADAALALGSDTETKERLIRELKNEIGRGSHEADLYLVLGRCYLARGSEGDSERARSCFLEAIEQTWGAAKQAAQQELDAIE